MGDNVFAGPVVDVEVADDDSVGKGIFKSLKSLSPDFVMLTDGEKDITLTAGELLQQSVGIAVGLREVGVEKGDVVMIISENCISACVASIATWFAGGVMCPVDQALKTLEFQHLLKILEPKVVICDSHILGELQDARRKLGKAVPIYIAEGEEDSNLPRLEHLFRDCPVSDFTVPKLDDIRKDLAAIICSSGSTGLPKGVGLSHYSMAIQRNQSTGWANTRILQTSYNYWLSGVLMLISSASTGVPRILLRSADPLTVLRAIDQYKPHMMFFSPSLLRKILQHPQFSEFNLSSLKLMIVGGSPLYKDVFEMKQKMMPDSYLMHGYAMTESGGLITGTLPDIDALSVGKVTVNCQVKIKDLTTGESLGPEEEGEIVYKTVSIMNGYVSDDKATREAFDEDGWFLSGDTGKFTEDGVLYITGRIKELIKIDNHQIYPTEIEAVIQSVPGILDVAVAGIPVAENSLPMALVVKDGTCDVSASSIIQVVEDNLSEFKRLRAGVRFVASLPRTSNGKLRRKLIQPIAEALYFADSK